MTLRRDLIAHKVTSLRIVVRALAVKNFLPKAGPPERFHAGCRKIGHSRYNSVTSVVGHGSYSFRALRPTYAGCNGYGFPQGFTALWLGNRDPAAEPCEIAKLLLILTHARTA